MIYQFCGLIRQPAFFVYKLKNRAGWCKEHSWMLYQETTGQYCTPQ